MFGDDTDAKLIIVDGSYSNALKNSMADASKMADQMKKKAEDQANEAKKKSLL